MHNHNYLGSATIGERGQIAIPAEARRAFDLEPGDKLLFFTMSNHLGLCMISAAKLSGLLEHLTKKAESLESIMSQLKSDKE